MNMMPILVKMQSQSGVSPNYFLTFFWIEQKGMIFDHDFGYSFPLFSFTLKKEGRRKGEWIAKVMHFCLIFFCNYLGCVSPWNPKGCIHLSSYETAIKVCNRLTCCQYWLRCNQLSYQITFLLHFANIINAFVTVWDGIPLLHEYMKMYWKRIKSFLTLMIKVFKRKIDFVK